MAERPHRDGAVGKALTLLTALRSTDGAVRLSELSRRTGLPKSTTHRVLHTLLAYNLVARVGQGYQALGPGEPPADRHERLLRRLAPFLGDVLRHTGQTASLAVLDGAQVVFPYRVHGHGDPWVPSDRSRRACAYDSAAGRLLMAFDPAAVERIAPALGMNDRALLDGELARIKRAGWAARASSYGTTCVAVPIPGTPGRPQVAVAVRGLTVTMQVDRSLYWLRHIADVARGSVVAPMARRQHDIGAA